MAYLNPKDRSHIHIRQKVFLLSTELVSYNEPNANTQLSTIDDSAPQDAVQKLLSDPLDKQIGQECSSCLELQDKIIELSEALKRTSIRTADQIPETEFEFTIPKEKYEMVREALKAKDAEVID